jgi:hypothetical protein
MSRPMNNPAPKHWIIEQIERNLFAIIAGAALIYSTSQTADAVTARDLDAISNKLTNIETKLQDRRGFMGCAVRSIDKMSEKIKVELPCQLELPE